MNIYITTINDKNIINNILELIDKNIKVIDVSSLLKIYRDKHYNENIIKNVLSKEIETLLIIYNKNKNVNNVLYIINDIDINFLSNFKEYVEGVGIHSLRYFLVDCFDEFSNEIRDSFDDVIYI